jgi:hypothetical protein
MGIAQAMPLPGPPKSPTPRYSSFAVQCSAVHCIGIASTSQQARSTDLICLLSVVCVASLLGISPPSCEGSARQTALFPFIPYNLFPTTVLALLLGWGALGRGL